MRLLPITPAVWCITPRTHYGHQGFSDSLRGPRWAWSPAVLEGLGTAASKYQVREETETLFPPTCTTFWISRPESLYICQVQMRKELKWVYVSGHAKKTAQASFAKAFMCSSVVQLHKAQKQHFDVHKGAAGLMIVYFGYQQCSSDNKGKGIVYSCIHKGVLISLY